MYSGAEARTASGEAAEDRGEQVEEAAAGERDGFVVDADD